MRNYFIIILNLVILNLISFGIQAQCEPTVPTFNVDLTGNPAAVWTSPVVQRQDDCCGGASSNCVQFIVTLDPGSAGIVLSVASGAVPGGALFYQVNCGPQTSIGTPVCLVGVGPHNVSFCKPGNNLNSYTITAIAEPSATSSLSINNGCSSTINTFNYQEPTVEWNSISPGAVGDWNYYLDCDAGCDTVTVAATDAFYPPSIIYEVCGVPIGGCAGLVVCLEVEVTFASDLVLDPYPDTTILCPGDVGMDIGVVASGGFPPYSYSWSTLETDPEIFVGAGNYTIVVSDGSDCPPTTEVITVTQVPGTIEADAGTDIIACTSEDFVSITGTVTGSPSGIWSGGQGLYSQSTNDLTLDYYPTQTEKDAGQVSLILTNAGLASCPPTSDTMTIFFVEFDGVNTIDVDHISCNGLTDGAAEISTVGAITPYSYSWNSAPVVTGTNVSGLSPGTYTVDVTDGNGCPTQESFTINQPALLTSSTDVDSISCFFGSDGEISITPYGGTGPYTYSWSAGGTTDSTASGLSQGSYTATVLDFNGCTTSQTVNLSHPSFLSSTITNQINVSCFGGNDGSATVSVTGGTPPYTYDWLPAGGNSLTASGLSEGPYTITVTDDKGCEGIANVIITEPAAPISAVQDSDSASCNGITDGSAWVTVSGGTPGYTYSWDTNASTDSISDNVTAGIHTVTITDTKNCELIVPIAVYEPSTLVLSTSINASTCALANGEGFANPSGGTPPYVYSWSSGGNQNNEDSLLAGLYDVTVTDSEGCSITEPVNILNATPALIVDIDVVSNVNCNNGNDGSVTTALVSGTNPISYAWAPLGGGTATGQNLPEGTFILSSSDVNGCLDSDTVTITEPIAPLSYTETISNVSCNGFNDGDITTAVLGGTTPYSYAWSNGDIDSQAESLISGTYTLTVTDANGCTLDTLTEVTQPSLLEVVLTTTDVSCIGGNNGEVVSVPSGGTLPYTYSWDNGDNDSIADNVTIGDYELTLTDGNGCEVIESESITEPLALSVDFYQDSVSCNGLSDGNLSIIVSGGTLPYTYSWDNGDNDTIADNVTAGVYEVTITDGQGCVLVESEEIFEPLPLTLDSTVTDLLCYGDNDGVATVIASGGTPSYSYAWVGTASTTSSSTGLLSGTYNVTVTDVHGCNENTDIIVSRPLAPLTLVMDTTDVLCFGGNDGEGVVTASGGTTPYVYLWSNTDADDTAEDLISGTYDVTVTDDNGCIQTGSIYVAEPSLLESDITSMTAVSCNGGSDGVATVGSSGGAGGYTYLWSPGGEITPTITGLTAGTYYVTTTDIHGCTTLDSAIITEPALPISSTTDQVDNLCFGESNGIAIVEATGGTSPYGYVWGPTVGTNDSLTNLPIGEYIVTITDAKGCTLNDTVTITEPPILSYTEVITNVSCNGLSDGDITSTVSGGTIPYSYTWSNGDTDSQAESLISGTYTLTVTDGNSCILDTITEVTQPTLLQVALTFTNVSCNGGSDGEVVSVPSGGTLPYTYSWDNGDNDSIADNVTIGDYELTLTDGNGCEVIESESITEPLALSVDFYQDSVSCNGLSDGNLSIIASGGTLPYTYSWDNGDNDTIADNVTAGVYEVTITDGQGCVLVESEEIFEPLPLTLDSTVTDLLCYGDNDGVATVIASGGTPSYSYAWVGTASTTSSSTGLLSGTYNVTVTDVHGCNENTDIIVSRPLAPLTLVMDTTDVLCFGGNDGEGVVTASGGTTPYVYLWSNADADDTAEDLISGTYDVTVTDDNGCIQTGSIYVAEPSLLESDITSMTAVSCNGGSDGAATVGSSGGAGGYTYLWSPGGETTPTIIGLTAGTYYVTTTDIQGCTTLDSAIITEPALPISSTTDQVDNLCFGESNGIAIVEATGGTSPYGYVWGPTVGTNDSLTNLPIGEYIVTITDAKGCTLNDTVTITEPPILSYTEVITNVSCNGLSDGDITSTVSGGTIPYSYTWSNGDTDSQAESLISGTYTLTVTDGNSCILDTITEVTQPTLLQVALTFTNVSCNGGSDGEVVSVPSGGTLPYTYSWDNGDNDSIADNVTIGDYELTLTDGNGCEVIESESITEPLALSVDFYQDSVSCNGLSDGNLSIIASGGTLPYTYSWDNGDNDTIADNVTAGVYEVTITDGQGCVLVESEEIFEPLPLTLDSTVTDLLCYGDNDGVATVIASGGTPSYSYAWVGTASTTSSSTGLLSGTYNVTVTDVHGCNENTDIIVSRPLAPLTLVMDTTDVLCFGGNDGEGVVTASGGTTPYVYLWSNADADDTAEDLISGTYDVTVTDDNGCIQTGSIYVAEPSLLESDITSMTAVSCNGGSDGTAAVGSSGGAGGYTYLWSPGGETTPTIIGLTAGTYYVTTTDIHGCTTLDSAIITEPALPISSTTDQVDNLCFGESNGIAIVEATGGTLPYTYLWSPTVGNNDSLMNLMAGQYIVTITDARGCTLNDTVTISEPDEIIINSTIVDATCNLPNGEVTASFAGGTPGYTYEWMPGNVSSLGMTGLASGSYTFYVTDGNACLDSLVVNISSIVGPTLVLDSITNVSCHGLSDGAIYTSGSGGIAPLVYSWNTGEATDEIVGITAGSYVLTLTDDNGCQDFVNAVVEEPDTLLQIMVVDSVSCFGESNGIITALTSGGTYPYLYSWDNGDNDSIANNLTIGTYQLTITDSQGCISIASEEIFEPTPLAVVMSATAIDCFGGTDGTAGVVVSGGTPSYQYSWNGGIGSLPSLTGLIADMYVVTVTDYNNCVIIDSIEVTQPAAGMSIVLDTTDVLCFGGNDGEGFVTANGGTLPYDYLWSNGDTDDTAEDLISGNYNVTVTDGNGCAQTGSIYVAEPSLLESDIISMTMVSCNAGSDGAATVGSTGGSGGYTYLWSPGGEITPTITGLSAGTYYVTTTDLQGCTTLDSAIITEPALPISSTTDQVDNLCFGESNGIAIVEATGGTSPYGYVWGPTVGTNDSLTNLPIGEYIVTITDIKGCTWKDTVTITEPILLTYTEVITNVSCNGFNDGDITSTPAGGTLPYSYAWSNGDADSQAEALISGTYTLTVTDGNGCELDTITEVTQPTSLQVALASTNVSCNGGNDGEVVSIPSGGTLPYNYVWDNGDLDSIAENLTIGVYELTLTDGNGCVKIVTKPITEPQPLSVSFYKDSVTCNGLSDGNLSIIVSGGTSPYSYSWDNGDTDSIADNVAAGIYEVTITDGQGCVLVASEEIFEPVPLSVVMSATAIDCFGGSNGTAGVVASGGTPSYQYSWNGGIGSLPSLTGLIADMYVVTVTDYNNCVIIDSIEVTQPAAGMSIVLDTTDVLCFGGNDGEGFVTANGGTLPYDYLWSNGDTDDTAEDLISGNYNVTVTDGNGCAQTGSIYVAEPSLLESDIISMTAVSCNAGSDGAATVGSTGGSGGYTYLWSPGGEITPTITGLSAGTYYVTTTDLQGCTTLDSAIITEPALPISSTTDQVDNLCFGESNGIAIVEATGGTSPYSYVWGPTVGTNDSLTNLPIGEFIVTITDIKGCTWKDTVTITEPTILSYTEVITDVSCNGFNDGDITSTPAGGTLPYSYAWSNGDADSQAEALISGTYTLTVTDGNGCELDTITEVTQPTILQVALTTTDVSCNGGNDGEIVSVASGGTLPYTYGWDNGDGDSVAEDLTIGTYEVTVTDGQGCVLQSSETIEEPLPLSVSFYKDSVTCNGLSDGNLSIIASGGTLPYTYSWDNGDNDSIADNVAAGVYEVTITDGQGCVLVASEEIFEPTPLAVVMNTTAVNCFGGTDGTAGVVTSGGTPSYQYSWNGGIGSLPSLTGLIADMYVVTVTDYNNCVIIDSIEVTQPAAGMSIVLDTTDVLCFGGNDGGGFVTANGGTLPYDYLWSNGDTDDTAEDLISGNYNVTVTDGNGCAQTGSIYVAEPSLLESDIISMTAVSCNAGSDGAATVGSTGGSGGYTYLWLPGGEITPTITGLSAGTYYVTTTDLQGCTTLDSAIITEPALPISSTTDQVDNLCFGESNGIAIVEATGGTSPYGYVWGPTVGTNDSLTNLPIGEYIVTITDIKGCTWKDTVTITEPPILSYTEVITNVSCNGFNDGDITSTPAGGTLPYSYAWSNGDSDSQAEDLVSGTYTLTVTDGNGCELDTVTEVTQPTILQVALTTTDVSCNGGNDGEIVSVASGGTLPYTYGWDNGDGDSVAEDLTIGTYEVTVTDGQGCVLQSSETIAEPLPLSVSFYKDSVTCNGLSDGNLSIIASGGTLPYTYSWDNGDNDSIADNVAAGVYEVTITDGQGCVLIASEEIFEPLPLAVVMNTTAVNCFGGGDGTAWVEISGGTLGYNVEWSNGFLNDTINSLIAGNYVVEILDRNDCYITSNINVTQPLQGLSFNLNVVPVDCNGASTGLAEVLTTGGTYPYTYSWSNGANDSINENIPAGSYQIGIVDANGCILGGSVLINQPSLMVTNIVNIDSSFCELPNGSALTTATGGVGPYTFLWSDGQTTALGSNFLQGNYSVTITDQNGCQNVNNVTIGNIPSPIVNATVDQIVSCFGGNDGEATALGTFGDGNYQYLWTPSGSASATPNNLAEGDNIVFLTDGNGCQTSDTIYVGQNTIIEIITDTIINVSCFGLSDAVVVPEVSGGVAAYTYLWSDNSINDTLTSVGFGQYVLTVTDALGCQMSEQFQATQPALLVSSIAASADELCVDSHDGVATVGGTGGTFPYSYSWNSLPVQNTITADGLSPGNYTVIITDNNGCIDSSSVVIGSPLPVVTTVMADDTICYGDGISLTATASGGTGNYLYYWNNAIGIDDNPNVSPLVETQYIVTAIDGNGCSNVSDSLVVSVISLFPSDLEVYGNSPICPGINTLIYAQINSTTTGSITYQWTPNLGTTAGAYNIIPTEPGYYVVEVTNECNVTVSDSVLIDWKPIPEVLISSDVTFGCEDLTVSFTDLSTTVVDTINTWIWDFGNGETSNLQNPTVTYENSGLYDVSLTVITDQGCVNDSLFMDYIDVYQLPEAYFETEHDFYSSFDMNVEFINNSINGSSYEWSFGDGNSSNEESPIHEYFVETNYLISLIVTSPEGCKDTTYNDLAIIEDYAMYVPNTFSPNGDGVNDIFKAEGIGLVEDKFEMWIFDRWGELIFFSYKPSVGWDGTFQGEYAPIGTYVWMIKTIDDENNLIPIRGHVNLIR